MFLKITRLCFTKNKNERKWIDYASNIIACFENCYVQAFVSACNSACVHCKSTLTNISMTYIYILLMVFCSAYMQNCRIVFFDTSSLVSLRTDLCARRKTTHMYCRRCPKKPHCRGQWFSCGLHVEFNELWSTANRARMGYNGKSSKPQLTKTSPMAIAVAHWKQTRPVQSRSGCMCGD